MAGIYIHIPFCEKKCGYCDFFSVKLYKDNIFVQNFIKSLLTEIRQKAYLFKGQTIETVYFGGGTPSILAVDLLERIFNEISKFYTLATKIECTIEINPEHAVDQYFRDLTRTGFINRLSTGFQSMTEQGLRYLGRNHSVLDNYRYLDLCEKYGYSNYSVDYIFGYEILTVNEIDEAFRLFASRKVPHISAYSLGIEENTPFMLKLKRGEINKMDDDFFLSQFKHIHYQLESLGYNHYEISNYSLPGMHSRHNSNYWDFVPYLGFGPSAHSYYNNSRSWNSRTLPLYNQQIAENELYSENEVLDEDDNFNEYIMLSFRTRKGVDINEIKSRYPRYFNHFDKNLHRSDLIEYFEVNGSQVNLNIDGIFISDYIISEFFV